MGTPITNRIRQLRFQHEEMTQQQLATRVGVTRLIVLGVVMAAWIVSAAAGRAAQTPVLIPAPESPFAIDPAQAAEPAAADSAAAAPATARTASTILR